MVDKRDRRPAGVFLRVDTPVNCVLTRFRVRSFWWIIPFYLSYVRVRREARQIKGLLKTAFLVEGPRTYYTLSIWDDDAAILQFSTHVRAHVHAATASMPATWCKRTQRAEIWSGQFRLWSLSPTNLNWEGLDLTALEPQLAASRPELAPQPMEKAV